jgi:hypothetical protein
VGRTAWPQPRSCLEDALFAQSERAGYLLAWTGALLFCAGLLGLAVLPSFGLAIPKGLILTWGVSCALLALLSPLLGNSRQQIPSGPRQDHGLLTGLCPDRASGSAVQRGP